MLAAHGTFHHVYDFPMFELPFDFQVKFGEFGLTKFMLLQIVAAALVFVIFRGLASKAAGGKPVTGWFWNFWEMLAVYLRDELVRPVIGDPHAHHETDVGHGHHHPFDDACHLDAQYVVDHAQISHSADKFLPFVWSCFFYILFCNLLGAFPWAGSATGSISMTAALAVVAFAATFFYGAQMHGPIGFWTHLVPAVDAPGPLKPVLIVMLFVIEVVGLFIKHSVLAIRLFANMMGGHTALGVMLAFIAQASTLSAPIYGMVTVGSLVGQIGIGILELLVAFIQAYVFAFLSTIFIAMSLHEH